MRQRFLQLSHLTHMSDQLIWKNIRELWYWPGMQNGLKMLTKNCQECHVERGANKFIFMSFHVNSVGITLEVGETLSNLSHGGICIFGIYEKNMEKICGCRDPGHQIVTIGSANCENN